MPRFFGQIRPQNKIRPLSVAYILHRQYYRIGLRGRVLSVVQLKIGRAGKIQSKHHVETCTKSLCKSLPTRTGNAGQVGPTNFCGIEGKHRRRTHLYGKYEKNSDETGRRPQIHEPPQTGVSVTGQKTSFQRDTHQSQITRQLGFLMPLRPA